MSSRKQKMNNYIRDKGEKIFELFYQLMTGNIDLTTLSEEEQIIADCIKNECTEESGACYEFYNSLHKIRNSKSKVKIIDLYESILKAMCEKMFFHALKLGYVLKNKLK